MVKHGTLEIVIYSSWNYPNKDGLSSFKVGGERGHSRYIGKTCSYTMDNVTTLTDAEVE